MPESPHTLPEWSRSRPPPIPNISYVNSHQLSNGDDEAESSASGSLRSGGSSRGRHTGVESTFSQKGQSNRNITQGEELSNRNRPRRSGGFLLESLGRPYQPQRSSGLSSFGNVSQEKEPAKHDRIKVSKQRPGRYKHQATSHGSSPLASHVANSTEDSASAQSADKTYVNSRRSMVSTESQTATEMSQDDAPVGHQHQVPPAAGYDTDPAQIVNMALTLSEGRRRNFSGARLVSGSSANHRVLSFGQPSPRLSDRLVSGNFGQNVNTRKASLQNNIRAPAQAMRHERKSSNFSAFQSYEDEPKTIFQEATDSENLLYDVSPATFARVEQAKKYFELLYEYRRLLPHLPPLRRPQNLNGPSRIDHQQPGNGRQYNPLQYARNRKIRFREKSPIQSEEEGWHDVEKVRTWVDAVIASHTEPRDDPDECIRLPPLQDKPPNLTEKDQESATDSPASSIKQRLEHTTSKPRRPRQDWVTFPGDFVADAFWLEQGLNKTKIEDHQGNKIYPSEVSIKFSDWRRRTPAQAEELPLSDAGALNSHPPENTIPELPSFRNSSRERTKRSHDSRRRSLRNSVVHSRHLEKRKRLNEKDRERHVSASGSSSDSEASNHRGRSKVSRHQKYELPSPLRRKLDRRAADTSEGDLSMKGSPHSNRTGASKEASPALIEDRRGSKPSNKGIFGLLYTKDEDARRSLSLHRRSDSKSSTKSPKKDDRNARSSFEETSTGPNSPTVDHFPSIAINLSPPASRSPSPRKKPLQERMNPFRADRDASKKRHGVETSDFAKNISSENSSRQPSGEEKPPASEYQSSRGTSPFDRRSSLPEGPPKPTDVRGIQTSIGKQNQKSSLLQDPSSRFRGIFKGGRIAELVGSEVSRVGDFIWKRDVPQDPHSLSATPSVSTLSDTEDEWTATTPSPVGLHRYPTGSSLRTDRNGLSPTQTRDDRPQYHMNNLPSFTSPFQKDKEQQEKLKAEVPKALDGDPITRQVREARSRSRSSRFERLAPPRLDLSPTPSRRSGSERRDSYGFGKVLNLAGPREASNRMNDAFSNKPKLVGPPITGLAAFNASHSQSPTRGRSRPQLEPVRSSTSVRDFSLSSQSFHRTNSANTLEISYADISRIRALLLSSGVKAREIYRRGHEVRDPPPKFLLDIVADDSPSFSSPAKDPSSLPPLIRREEHVWASKRLISSLETRSHSFRTELQDFSLHCAPALHARLQGINDLVENELNPRVRQAADDAGALSQKMSTSSTLAIKQLNDAVDAAIRRRSKGRRWLRRVGYVVLEWAVLGLMWWAWLLVMIFKVVRGMVRGWVWFVRWLLWL
ncbi:MAG: hypothetical protein Q9227_000704 [Pyrenula ochraceoflavens]